MIELWDDIDEPLDDIEELEVIDEDLLELLLKLISSDRHGDLFCLFLNVKIEIHH